MGSTKRISEKPGQSDLTAANANRETLVLPSAGCHLPLARSHPIEDARVPTDATQRSALPSGTEKSATLEPDFPGPRPNRHPRFIAAQRLWDTGHHEEAVQNLEQILLSDGRFYFLLAV